MIVFQIVLMTVGALVVIFDDAPVGFTLMFLGMFADTIWA
jgi:hypothetical protein